MSKNTTADRLRYAVRQGIEKVQADLPVAHYLRALGVEVKGGRAKCIVHGGDNPSSFAINPESGKWRCHACGEWGSVVDLCKLVEGHDETHDALVSLSTRFDVQLPRRPERWNKLQDEKAKAREAAKRYLAGVYQRRLTRVYAPLVLVGGQGPEEELVELQGLAAALWPVSLSMAERRVVGE